MSFTLEATDLALALETDLLVDPLLEGTQNLLNEANATNAWQQELIELLTKQLNQATANKQKFINWGSQKKQNNLVHKQDFKHMHNEMLLQNEKART
eukprot:Ihof_evm4s563 gene=Ihof_evmTU4s563